MRRRQPGTNGNFPLTRQGSTRTTMERSANSGSYRDSVDVLVAVVGTDSAFCGTTHEPRRMGHEEIMFATSRVLARRHGLLVGGTAGAAIHEGVQTLQTCSAVQR